MHKIEKTGTYHIIATSLSGGNGPFVLTVAEFAVKEAKVLPLKLEQGKATLTGSLNDQDGLNTQGKFYKAYAFQAEAKRRRSNLMRPPRGATGSRSARRTRCR